MQMMYFHFTIITIDSDIELDLRYTKSTCSTLQTLNHTTIFLINLV